MRYFPLGINPKYYSSEFYYWGHLADGIYTCKKGIDEYNVLCIDTDYKTLLDGKTVEYKYDDIATCDKLPKKYCQRPTEIVDVGNLYTFSEMCIHEKGEFCSKVTFHKDIVRPKNADMRSDPSVKLWFMGHPSYTLGYDYICEESKDQLDPINDYHNIWCDFRNKYEEPGIYDDGNEVYCVYPGRYFIDFTPSVDDSTTTTTDAPSTALAPIESDTELTTEAPDSTTVSYAFPTDSKGRRLLYTNFRECTANTCDMVPGQFCFSDIDLYSLDDKGEAILVDTCIHDGLESCISKDAKIMEFHKPTNHSNATANWWYVGSMIYDTTTAYQCGSDQNVGTTDHSYINILCDPDFTGEVTKKDAIKCKDKNNHVGLPTSRNIDCRPQQCYSLPGDMCKQPLDLYTDDGAVAKMVDTCVSDGEGGCKSKIAGAFHPPTDDSEAHSTWWYVGSNSYNSSTNYECDVNQDISTERHPYINILCDRALTGTMFYNGTIKCRDSGTEVTADSNDNIDCGATDCYSISPEFCNQHMDLYIDDGARTTYSETCIQSRDGESCEPLILPETTSTGDDGDRSNADFVTFGFISTVVVLFNLV